MPNFPTPLVLSAPGPNLWRQVIAYLGTDTDQQSGLVAALGDGAASIFPNFLTNGPNSDRNLCPTPFLIVVSGGRRAKDLSGREDKITVELHDDPEQGDIRWPGLLERVYWWLSKAGGGFAPSDTASSHYLSRLAFESESPLMMDERYRTQLVAATFACRVQDRTSGRGRQG